MGVIDELVVLIGLDPSKFREGRRALDQEIESTKRNLESFGRDVESSGHKISEVFGLTKRGVAGILATFVGAEAAGFIDRVAMMDAHTSRLAHSIGMSTRELSIWQNMVRNVGGSATDANATFGALADTFNAMQMGGAPPSAGFASLLSRSGVNWRTSTPGDALQRIMQFLGNQPEKQQRFWLSQVPGMNENMMFLMLEGIKNMQRFREEIEKIGAASEDSGAAARDLQEKTGELATAWENFSRVLFPSLTAALNTMTALFTGRLGGWIASILGGMATGAAVGSVVPGLGTGLGAIAGGAAGALTYGLSGSGAAGGAAAGAGATRGDRNNNPGNIKAGPWATAHGATGADSGGFAIFPSFQAGAAAAAQLLHDRYQGLTLSQIQQRWVGDAEGGYLAQMMKATGLGANDVPNLNDNATVAALMRGIMAGEGTHQLKRGGTGTGGTTHSKSITINGGINVSSSKADPKAVADQVPAAIDRYSMLGGINSGLT